MATGRFARMFVAVFAIVASLSQISDATAPRILVLEWIPLSRNTEIIESLQSAMSERFQGLDAPLIERQSVYGDDAEVERILSLCEKQPPTVLLAIGDHLFRQAAAKCPDVPIVALFTQSPSGSASGGGTPRIVIQAEPTASMCIQTASAIRPQLETVAVIYTVKFAPNESFAEQLDNQLKASGKRLVRIPIDPGYCRTESDFENAILDAAKSTPFDVLVVPSDPNCDRFAPTVYRAAEHIHVPSIGSEATVGRGCVAALLRDAEAVGRIAARVCIALVESKDDTLRSNYTVEAQVAIDTSAMKANGIEGLVDRLPGAILWK